MYVFKHYFCHTARSYRGVCVLQHRVSLSQGHLQLAWDVDHGRHNSVLCISSHHFSVLFLSSSHIEQVFHVSVPNQPSAEAGEGILKLSNQTSVCIISPTSGKPLLEIPFRDIRRLGCMEAYNHDLVWIETCKSCRGGNNMQPNQFYFFVVPSGPANSRLVAKDLKIGVERCTGVFLILEESDQFEIAYISRDHYGCAAYLSTARNRIIHSGITQGSTPWNLGPIPTQRLVQVMQRPSEPTLNIGLSLEEYATAKPTRRGTFSISNLPSTGRPHHPLHRGMTTLDRFRKASLSSIDSHSSLEMTDGNSDLLTPVSDVFEPSFALPNGSPHRKNLSQTDSISSRGSAGSSSPIAEEPGEEDEEEPRMHPLRKRSRSRPELRVVHNPPYIPPRSPASLLKLRARTPSIN